MSKGLKSSNSFLFREGQDLFKLHRLMKSHLLK